MPHRLVCPSCTLSLAAGPAPSALQHCPRCLLRHRTPIVLRPERTPGRFARAAALERATQARAGLGLSPR